MLGFVFPWAICVGWLSASANGAPWHHPLYLDGGGYWPARIPVVIRNGKTTPLEGEPVVVRIGAGRREANLVGVASESIRVTTEAGQEVLFALLGSDGQPREEGPLPAGSELVIPAECPPGEEAVYFVYFDNPAAGRLPEFLAARPRRTAGDVKVGRPERVELRERGARDPWHRPPQESTSGYTRRAVAKVLHFEPTPRTASLVAIDASILDARMGGRLHWDSVRVTHNGHLVPYLRHGSQLLLETSLPARSVNEYCLYFSDHAGPEPPVEMAPKPLVSGSRNLVKNPSFEEGGGEPAHWTFSGRGPGPDGPNGRCVPANGKGLGKRCVRLDVPAGQEGSWRGWNQAVPVQPGRHYLLACWVKCQDVRDGEIRVHAHLRRSDGSLSQHNPFRSIGPAISGTTDWTWMSGVVAVPPDASVLQLHLTTDCSGTVWHDGMVVAEVVPGRITAFEGRPAPPDPPVSLWPVPAVVKVFPDDPVPASKGPLKIWTARNETEPLQLALRSSRPIRDLRVVVDPPRGPGGVTLEDCRVNLVGLVPIDHPTSYYRSDAPAWHLKKPDRPGSCDGWPGLWPDPLLPAAPFDLEAHTTRAVWVQVTVPPEAPAGDYAGAIRLLAPAGPLATVPWNVHVWDFTLPETRHLAAIYDVRLGPASHLWGKPLEAIYPKIVRFLAERRLCPDTIRPFPSIRLQGGQVVADFTEFDRAAERYFDQLRLPVAYTPWTFYLFGWGHPPKAVFGQRPYPGEPPYTDADRSKLRPEFQQTYQAALRAFWEHLKERGWDKKVVLYISDEPFDRKEPIVQQMKALCEMIHEVDPAIPIYSSTWHHVPAWDGYLDVWGIGHDGRVPAETMAALRAAGDRIWFTTDGQMCIDTPYCAIERLLPHYCFRYGAEAYEFWGASWLTRDPYRFGWHAYIRQTSEPGETFWIRYPNGDGYLIYPGGPLGHPGLVSSIRLEQAREGVEDYEYLYLLRQRTGAAEAAGRDTSSARAALAAAHALVELPSPLGRYSTQILPQPERLYHVRQQVAEAIQQLAEPASR